MAGNDKHTPKVKTCTLYVDGMHCQSCEVLIERKLLKQEGVKAADVSLQGRTVEITYAGSGAPDPELLSDQFADLGYRFSRKKFAYDAPFIRLKNGRVLINSAKTGQAFQLAAIVVSLLIAFLMFERLQLGQFVSVDSSSALPAFFVLGLVAGLSSCAALIGGLLLSLIKQWNEQYIDAETTAERAIPHWLFHAGRLIGFTLLGGLLGLAGEAVSLNNATFFAVLTVVVSIIMFILALQMLGVTWAQKLTLRAPKSLTRFAADESNFTGRWMPFAVGAGTFFLPCGFTLIAQTVALTSGSFMQGALIMLMFALGTFPTLLGISFGGLVLNRKPQLTAKFNMVAGLVVIFFALYNINGQLNVLGLPSLSDIQVTSTVEEVPLEPVDGVQVLNFTAQGFEYIPEGTTTLTAGVPAKLVVNNKGIQGCGAFMAANGLIDNFYALKPGINEIDLGVPVKGTYKLTCSMGMVRPITITVI
ncbi:MAG: Heavy-metal-associated domain protein [candidate division WS6 bacterium OLB20]|uniref:Heavy-metal-associated domain protein n=1 Tax=candidate division WS6 bacterium OLB20 TaxID=1617426 RepID=A0A136LWW2_9BACT|nr:MAG: Heavy-metal-associated domain protein [candidate division WS6 bacterium OLB20]